MPSLSDQEIKDQLNKLDGWERAEVGGKPGISKTFKTGNFLSGLAFVTHTAVLAEQANHHPDVILTYLKVTMQLTTHDSGGLTSKDFDLAQKLDAIKL